MDSERSTSGPASATATITDRAKEDFDGTAFTALLEERRRELGVQAGPEKPIAAKLPKIPQPKPAARVLTEEELIARDDVRRRNEEATWRDFANGRGRRYAECRLGNFNAESEPQKAAVASLLEYCQQAAANIADGQGVVLFGPRGTGKDHLAMAVARAVVMQGKQVVWRNGMDLYGDIRDAMGEDGETESSIIRKLVIPDLLYLSDPLPITGVLSQHQMNMLFRILDGRYSQRRATLCTVNVASGTELDERMGPQNADRLKDGALAIYCNWSSYRKARQ